MNIKNKQTKKAVLAGGGGGGGGEGCVCRGEDRPADDRTTSLLTSCLNSIIYKEL